MFDCKQTLTGRLTNAVDLMMDFATLGEYGLEPVGRAPERCNGERRRIQADSGRSPRPIPARTAKKKEPAATYSPRGLPPKYHRR